MVSHIKPVFEARNPCSIDATGAHPNSMADRDGFSIDAQRAIGHCAALIMQDIDLDTAHTVERVRAAARLQFEVALAVPIRARNARKSAVFSVPNELWVSTWSYLPAHDRVIVSHVCHAWREVALAAPTLWTEIVSTYHSQLASGIDYWRCQKCSSFQPPEIISSSLAFVRALLDRSGGLPISVRVINHHDSPHLSYMCDLGHVLQESESRLAELHISVGSESYLAFALLDALQTLPALRALTVSITEEDVRYGDPVFEDWYGFPALESLNLSPGLSWGHSFELPRLRVLSLAVYGPFDLSTILCGCPALQSLSIIPRFAPDEPWDAALLKRLGTVPDVCIDGMRNTHARWFARSNMPAPAGRVRLVYPDSVPSRQALRVLRDFTTPVHALCAVDRGRHIVELSDASRTLILEWPLALGVAPVWDLVSPSSIEADPEAWSELLSYLQPSHAASVQRLTLRFYREEDILKTEPDPYRCLRFSSVRELTLRGMRPGVGLDFEGIRALWEQLCLPSRVSLFCISGIRLFRNVRE